MGILGPRSQLSHPPVISRRLAQPGHDHLPAALRQAPQPDPASRRSPIHPAIFSPFRGPSTTELTSHLQASRRCAATRQTTSPPLRREPIKNPLRGDSHGHLPSKSVVDVALRSTFISFRNKPQPLFFIKTQLFWCGSRSACFYGFLEQNAHSPAPRY
jgi:hypothetical protein